MKVLQLFLLTTVLIILLFVSCNNENSFIADNPLGTLQKLQVIAGNIPLDVDQIIGILSNPKYDTIIEEFTITADSAYCIFQDIPVGIWHLVVQAYFNTELTYEGEAYLTISKGSISYVTIHMNKIEDVGIVHIGLVWDSPTAKEYLYDFNNNDLSGWYGTADATITNNQLVLTNIGFKWHTIEYNGDKHFISGDIEYEVYPMDGSIAFSTKGDSYLDGSLNWGVYVYFRNDSVFTNQFIDQKGKLIYTNYKYQRYTWHTVKFRFNNNEGEKGKYDLWISENVGDSAPVYLGQYDYYASKGRLRGFNQFVFSNIYPEEDVLKKAIYDNIRFTVK